MERNNVITTLEVLRSNCSKHSRDYQALDYAISSLKTDEAYQIMYEGGEIYTKADIVAMLTEIRTEIDKQCKIPNDCASAYDWNNGVYACYKVVQQKIDALKESENG